MNIRFTFLFLGALLSLQFNAISQGFTCEQAPEGTIWCDDFEDDTPMDEKYFEYGDNDGDFIVMPYVGRDSSRGLRVIWQQGEIGAGGMKKSFGRTPSSYIGKYAVFPDEDFNEIYWRMDVKSMEGWTGGGPAKLSRALCLANSNWATGMMAHLWSHDDYLGMDPASGILADGSLVSTKYNDFDNLRWLGFKEGTTDIYSTENSGKWYCIEGHVKLNTPGENDGIFEFWINDTLQAGTYNLNWHGTWNNNPDNYMINAVFFENYWNDGSPVEQERYFDNIVISTMRIGCNCGTDNVKEGSNEANKFRLSPNPVKDYINISLPKANPGYKIIISDMLGRTVYTLDNISSETINANAGAWQSGLYSIRIISDKGIVYSSLFQKI